MSASPLFRRFWWFRGLVPGLAICLGFSACTRDTKPVAAVETWAHFERMPAGDQSAFRFTAPIEVDRLATEWEPQRAVLLGVSLSEMMAASDLAPYQIAVMAAVHRYVEIYVFCEHDESRAFAYFLSQLNAHPEADAILARTHFIDSRNLARWTRDYGPVFARGVDGGTVLVDAIYRDLLRDMEESTRNQVDSRRRLVLQQGDAMPADVAAYLQQRFKTDVTVVRPPLWMDGGDFVHDGRGNVFVSRQTLVRNGGNKADLLELFQRYYGAKRLHILQALPGATVSHLDMVLKFADPQTVILPVYQPTGDEGMNRYRRELTRQVQDVLAANEAYVKTHLPDVRILKMPMPPILFMNESEILEEARAEFLQAMALSRGLTTAAALPQLDRAGITQLETRILALVQEEIGAADFGTVTGFNAVLRRYGQPPLHRYFDLHSEATTRYRSYLNSLFLHGRDGAQAFLVPRFTAQGAATADQILAWENEVIQVYQQARPEARIHWVDCDAMIADMGFVHCTTITVPDWMP